MILGAELDITADVDLDGERLRVVLPRPDGPNACLWALTDDWMCLFPGSLPEDQRGYWTDRLEDPDDNLDRAALLPIAHELSQQVYGVPWWAAHRICEEAAQKHLMWEAWCIKHGFDASGEPAHRIIASIVGWVAEGWEDDSQAKAWSQKMFMRPKNARR